jgi:hypothetical protein
MVCPEDAIFLRAEYPEDIAVAIPRLIPNIRPDGPEKRRGTIPLSARGVLGKSEQGRI